MLGIIFKMFIVLLSSIVNTSNHTKCVFLSNQKRMIQPTLINLRPKTQTFYILLAFLLITIALSIAVSIYCYLIRYRGK